MGDSVQVSDRYISSWPINLKDCASRFVKMTDTNYDDVLSWFKQCFDAGRHLPTDLKDEYMLEIVENIRRSTDDFFQYTHLPVQTLSSLEKQISSSISQALRSSPDLFTKGSSKCETTTDASRVESSCALQYAKLCNKLMWAAIVAGILLLLLFLLLLTLCWLRNCMARELTGGAACCAYTRGLDGAECTCVTSHDGPHNERKSTEPPRKSESK